MRFSIATGLALLSISSMAILTTACKGKSNAGVVVGTSGATSNTVPVNAADWWNNIDQNGDVGNNNNPPGGNPPPGGAPNNNGNPPTNNTNVSNTDTNVGNGANGANTNAPPGSGPSQGGTGGTAAGTPAVFTVDANIDLTDAVAPYIDMGRVPVGATGRTFFYVHNTGGSAGAYLEILYNNAGTYTTTMPAGVSFNRSECNDNVLPGRYCRISVLYTPTDYSILLYQFRLRYINNGQTSGPTAQTDFAVRMVGLYSMVAAAPGFDASVQGGPHVVGFRFNSTVPIHNGDANAHNFFAFDTNTSQYGSSVALGNMLPMDIGGIPYFITGSSQNAAATNPSAVRIWNPVNMSAPIAAFPVGFPYDATMTGGVNVASCDYNGDGYADIITAPMNNWTSSTFSSEIRVWNGKKIMQENQFIQLIAGFTPFGSSKVGINLACADVNGDGKPDIIVGPHIGGGPVLRVYSGADNSVILSTFVFNENARGGLYVAGGDLVPDGKAEILAGEGSDATYGQSRVTIFDGALRAPAHTFQPYESTFTGGVQVGIADFNVDGIRDILTGPGPGGGPRIRGFNGRWGNGIVQLDSGNAFIPSISQDYRGGSRVVGTP